MVRMRKGMAIFLAVLMIVSVMSMVAMGYLEEGIDGEYPYKNAEETLTNEEAAESKEIESTYDDNDDSDCNDAKPYEELDVTAFAFEVEDALFEADPGDIIFNLGTLEVTVGFDEERYNGWTYMLFDEQGNFTITLEDDAFFPYEVQFQANGQT